MSRPVPEFTRDDLVKALRLCGYAVVWQEHRRIVAINTDPGAASPRVQIRCRADKNIWQDVFVEYLRLVGIDESRISSALAKLSAD